jgi:hypothetical protein
MKTIKIYALKDPNTFEVKYVGKTQATLRLRLDQHMSAAFRGKRMTPKDAWLYDLILNDREPIIEIIETVTGNWQEREQYWIKYYKTFNGAGKPLTNATIGGMGVRR